MKCNPRSLHGILRHFGGSQEGGFQKGGFGKCSAVPKPERGYIGMFPCSENRDEGTFGCSSVPRTGMRAHSPKPPFYDILSNTHCPSCMCNVWQMDGSMLIETNAVRTLNQALTSKVLVVTQNICHPFHCDLPALSHHGYERFTFSSLICSHATGRLPSYPRGHRPRRFTFVRLSLSRLWPLSGPRTHHIISNICQATCPIASIGSHSEVHVSLCFAMRGN